MRARAAQPPAPGAAAGAWARRRAPLFAALVALGWLGAGPAGAQPPNIIVFLVDDLGWMDTGAYGSRYYETPSIDGLARRGVMFTSAYAASPHCSPTRASILTGRYPVRIGITSAAGAHLPRTAGEPRYPESAGRTVRWLLPHSLRYLPGSEITIAEVLRREGYRTAHIGKWHLGQEPRHWPDRQGFEVVFNGAPDAGPPSYFSPYGFLAGNITDGPPGEYITDRLTDEALRFIEASRDRPFLLHLSHFGVHGPWGHREELAREAAGRRDPTGRQGNPIMAAMIRSIDQSLERILSRLAELGLERRTLVVFVSDNGGAMHTRLENGMLPTSNAPLRGAKGLLLEGGVRVPLIVSWPGRIEAGGRREVPVSTIDLFPTWLEAAGVRDPDAALDGVSLMPVLERGGARQRGALARRPVFNYHALAAHRAPPGASVRRGRWKLIRWFQTSPWFPRRLELYDLEADVGETLNLAERMPRRAARLDALIDGFLAATGALPPRPNPDYEARAAALGGWSPRGTECELGNGVLRCSPPAAGGSWRLRLSILKHRGERDQLGSYRLDLRVRAAAAAQGEVRVLGAESDEVRQRQPLRLPAGPRWRTVSLELEVDRAPAKIQLEVPAAAGEVELDSIRLRAAAGFREWPTFGSRQEWSFELEG